MAKESHRREREPVDAFLEALDWLDVHSSATAVASLTVLTDVGLLRDLALSAEKRTRRTKQPPDNEQGGSNPTSSDAESKKWTHRFKGVWDDRAHERLKDLTEKVGVGLVELGGVVGPKAKGMYRRIVPAETLDEQLEQVMLNLEAEVPVADLHAAILNLITTRLGLTSRGPSSARDRDWYRQVLADVAKEFGIDADKLSDRSLHDQVVQGVLDDALKRFRENNDDKVDSDELRSFLDDLESGISGIGPEDQRDVARELGIDDLSRESIRVALRQGTLGAGLFLSAHALHGALFIFATSLLHAIATTTFGIGLGFGAYTFLTHWLAVAIGPIGIAAWLTGMELYRRRFRRRINRRVVSMVLIQVVAHEAVNAGA